MFVILMKSNLSIISLTAGIFGFISKCNHCLIVVSAPFVEKGVLFPLNGLDT